MLKRSALIGQKNRRVGIATLRKGKFDVLLSCCTAINRLRNLKVMRIVQRHRAGSKSKSVGRVARRG